MTTNENPKALSVTLRPVTPDDEDLLFQIYASAREAELSLSGWDEHQRAAFLLHQFTAQRNHYHRFFPSARHEIILADDVPAGRLWVERNAEEIRILDLVVLTASRRGGTGTTLVRELQAEATRAAKPLRVSIEINNPSLELFRRLGFVVIEEKGAHLVLAWEPSNAMSVTDR